MPSKLLLALVTLSMSCSVLLQDSVRSSSVYCSTSRFYYLADLVIAGAGAYAITRPSNPPNSLVWIPVGVEVGSAAIGILKRHNCVRWRETAPPEVWAAAAEAARQQAEANARAQAEADAARAAQEEAFRQQQLANPPAPEPEPQPQPIGQPQPAPPARRVVDLCYNLDCNGSKTGQQCFRTHADYCASLCASSNCLAAPLCQANCR